MRAADAAIIMGTISVVVFGSLVTGLNMAWYDTLALPGFTPDGSIIGMVWTTIFVLTAIASMIVWRRLKSKQARRFFVCCLILNGLLNVGWSAIFFGLNLVDAAVFEAILLALSVAIILRSYYDYSRIAAILMAPYLGWVIFATYLTFAVWQLNMVY